MPNEHVRFASPEYVTRTFQLDGLTLGELRKLKLPDYAVVEYEGCGTHRYTLTWKEEKRTHEASSHRDT